MHFRHRTAECGCFSCGPFSTMIHFLPTYLCLLQVLKTTAFQVPPSSLETNKIKRSSSVTTNPICFPGIYLHAERTAGQTRADGTVPRPSLLERYLHRPLDTAFDEMDIATYHSEHAMSKTPPQYAASNTWTEKPWGDCANHLLVYRQRPTPKVLKILLNICWPKISRHNACVQRITLYPIHD